MFGDSNKSHLKKTGRFLAARGISEGSATASQSAFSDSWNIVEDIGANIDSWAPYANSSFQWAIDHFAPDEAASETDEKNVTRKGCLFSTTTAATVINILTTELDAALLTIPLAIDVGVAGGSFGVGEGSPDTIFLAIDVLREQQVNAEIDRIRAGQIEGALAVAARLGDLADAFRDERSGSISPESLRSLATFLESSNLKTPEGLTVDDDGLAWATWRKSEEAYLALKFYIDGRISYSMAAPSRKRFGKTMYFGGVGGVEDFSQALPKSMTNWLRRKKSKVGKSRST